MAIDVVNVSLSTLLACIQCSLNVISVRRKQVSLYVIRNERIARILVDQFLGVANLSLVRNQMSLRI